MSRSAPATYLLDANVFIEASRRYYAFDLAPQFWRDLDRCARRGQVRSVDRVLDEINQVDDRLKEWANGEFKPWFEGTGEGDIVGAYARIMIWVQQKDYAQRARDDFARASNADAWVVACALARGYVVVTHEQLSINARKKIPLPNVCREFDVRCIDTFEMMHELGIALGQNTE